MVGEPLNVLILVDNERVGEPLRTEHGLAMLLGRAGRSLLFDTGQTGDVLLHNAHHLGAPLDRVENVVFSHGHYDHTGGLGAILRRWLSRPTLYAHPGAFARRWANRPGRPMKDISCPHDLDQLRSSGVRFRPVTEPWKLEDWLVLSGPLGGCGRMAETFVVRRDEELLSDDFQDEVFLLARTRGGWALLTGCCHRGLPNTLRAASFLARGEPITAVVGGLHLRSSDEPDLEAVCDALGRHGRPELYPCHCTGAKATEWLAEHYSGRVEPLKAGSRLVL